MRTIRIFSAVVVLSLLSLPVPSQAAVSFFLSNGTDPAGDQAWQTAVGSFTEFDLDSFANGQVVQNLSDGSTIITIGPGATGQEIFFGIFEGPAGGVFGTVFEGALLNRDGTALTAGLTFDFSQPVSGFGLWIFDDDAAHPNSFTMTVTESGGTTQVRRVPAMSRSVEPARPTISASGKEESCTRRAL